MSKKDLIREWALYDVAVASEITDAITFNGKKYAPDPFKAFVVCEMAHSLPAANSKSRAFTAATMANSSATARLQLQNFQHRMEIYGAERDRVCGVIVDVEFPAKKDAVALSSEGKAVPMKALICVWRNARGVTEMLLDMATGAKTWKVSMECAYAPDETALFDGEKFYPWAQCTDEMKALVKAHTVEDWDGKKMTLVLGGEDGNVIYNGNAFTEFPADPDADIKTFAASQEPKGLIVKGGWRTRDEYVQAVAEAAKVKTKQANADLIIGITGPGGANGHTHEVAANLTVLASGDGHSHYLQVVNFNPETGTLEGIASGGYWDRELDKYVEHNHKVVLGKGALQETAAVRPPVNTEGFGMLEHIKYLKETAAALRKGGNNELAAGLEKQAAELETSMAASTIDKKVDETMEARIKAGALVTKAEHDKAIDAAKKVVRDELAAEAAAKAEAEKRAKETAEKRAKAVAEAGLDPKFPLRADKSLEQVVAEIPSDDAGDKLFDERLQEWAAIAKRTGAMKISTASNDGGKPVVPPHAGDVKPGSGGDAKKPAFALV